MQDVGSITFHTDGSYHVNDEYPVNDATMERQFGGNKYYLMAFTGLLDRNSKEIYEGDVVTIPYVDPMGGLHTDTPNGSSKVGFENGQFVIYRTEPQALVEWCKKEKGEYVSNYGNLTIVSDTTILEIIGNVYENPELLK